jgi:hypothetical protein
LHRLTRSRASVTTLSSLFSFGRRADGDSIREEAKERRSSVLPIADLPACGDEISLVDTFLLR